MCFRRGLSFLSLLVFVGMIPTVNTFAQRVSNAPTAAEIKSTAALQENPRIVEKTAANAPGMSEGVIRGIVIFSGAPPEKTPISMRAFPECVALNATKVYDQTIEVSLEGRLANVFVYVKHGTEGKTFPTPTGPIIFQIRACQFVPRIFGIQVGQPLQIVNADPVLSNTHSYSKINEFFNIGLPVQRSTTRRIFNEPEVMIPIKSDIHKWMIAYMGVLDHPFYDVTRTDGTFFLQGLPPGEYEIEAWHEKLGSQTQKVSLTGREPVELTFTFHNE